MTQNWEAGRTEYTEATLSTESKPMLTNTFLGFIIYILYLQVIKKE